MLGDARVDEVTIGGGSLPSRPDSTRSALPCASPCVDAGDKNVKLLGLVRRGVVDLREAGISRTKGTSPGHAMEHGLLEGHGVRGAGLCDPGPALLRRPKARSHGHRAP